MHIAFVPFVAALIGSAPSPVVHVDAARVEGPTSPLLYGQFMEFMFGGVKGGLSAELLRNRSFGGPPDETGLPRGWEREPDDRNDDDSGHYGIDPMVFLRPRVPSEVPGQSLRIEVGADDGLRRGVRQGAIPVRAGLVYEGSIWFEAKAFSGALTIALEQDRTGGARYGAAEIAHVGPLAGWQQRRFRITCSTTDPLAKLAVLVRGKGTLWIDQPSLLPGDAVGMVRRDVFERLKAVRPAFIRWPGGNVAQDYHWTWGIGPRDQRPEWINLSWWNERENGDIGTEEYLSMCRDLGAEPTLTVNVEGRGATVDEALAWLDYTRGRVKIWEIGNEIWGGWVRGHTDAATYAANCARYTAAMAARDASLRFIVCGDNDMAWNRTVLAGCGPHLDWLAVHHYYPLGDRDDWASVMGRPLHYERFYGELRKLIGQTHPGRRVGLAINEWNTSFKPPRQHSIESALFAARMMNVFERQGELVTMSAVSDAVNGWHGGMIQASRHGVFVTPTYHVNRLYAERQGAARLAARADGDPALDVVASRSADGREIYVKVLNTDRDAARRISLDVAGVRVAPRVRWELIAAPLAASNSFATPDAIRVDERKCGLEVELPAHSISVFTLYSVVH